MCGTGYAWHLRLTGLTAAKDFIEHMGRLNAAGSQKLSEAVREKPVAWPSSQLSGPQLVWVAALLPGVTTLPSSMERRTFAEEVW